MHKIYKQKINIVSTSLALVMGVSLLAGCGQKEEEPLITIESGDDTLDYSYTACIRDDISEKKAVKCSYKKNAEQEVYFPVSGKKIDKVYVKLGDEVKKGDILASLNIGSLDSDIEDLRYYIARNELLKGYITEQENIDIQSIYLDYFYGNAFVAGDEENRDNRLNALKEQNEKRDRQYSDSLEFDKRKLAQLSREFSESKVVADFDGTVSFVEDGLEGSTTNVEKCIMRILDNEEGYFETEIADATELFNDGAVYEMKVMYGNGKGDYEVTPMDMENWGETQKFSIVTGENIADLDSDSRGEIYIETSRRENVLSIPKKTVHYAGEDAYVYVLDEEGMRDVRWVETGIEGDGKVEILSGLDEGDKVITR